MLAFALAGGAIFAAYAQFGSEERPTIVVSDELVQTMVDDRKLTLDRDLSEREREQLIDDYVNNEILVQEAVARGLYRLDAKVRRRLVGKMNFLLAEEPPEPTSQQLQALFDANPDAYLTPRSVSFEHVFFRDRKPDASGLLEDLRASRLQLQDAGDRFWLGSRMERYTSRQLLMLLGFRFDQALRRLPVGEWQGPIESGRGWHLVRVTERHEPRLLPDDVLQLQLVENWKNDWRKRRRDETFAALRARYDVVLPGSQRDG